MARKTQTLAASGALLLPTWEFCVFVLIILVRGRLLRRILRAAGVSDASLEQLIGKRVDGALWVFLLCMGIVPFALALESVLGHWVTVLFSTIALALAFHIIIQCLDLVLFSWYTDRRNAQISGVMRTAFVSVLYGVAVLLLLDWQLGVSVLPLLATSTILTAVLGLAMQDTIKNVVAGLSISLDKSVAEGEWIVLGLDGKTSLYGQITEVGWRSTKIRTTINTQAVIPNADLINHKLINLSKSPGQHGIDIELPVAWQEDCAVVKQKILAAVKGVAGVLDAPEPELMPVSMGPEQINLRLRFWTARVDDRESATGAVLEAVWPVLKTMRPNKS